MPQQVVAYRRWRTGFVNYQKDVTKCTDIVCINCHNSDPDNDERDAAIVLRSRNGASIKSNAPKCAACGNKIKVQESA